MFSCRRRRVVFAALWPLWSLLSPAPGAEAPRPFVTGDRVRLRADGGSGVWLATREFAWDDMLAAENAGSSELMRRLAERGEAIFVRNGTAGVVVRTALYSALVRVTEGPFRGAEGWVQREYLGPDAPPPAPRAVVPRGGFRQTRTSPAARALMSARNLETAGKVEAAQKEYRRVVRDYPGTDEARIAALRVDPPRK